jgi:hypothetical protein
MAKVINKAKASIINEIMACLSASMAAAIKLASWLMAYQSIMKAENA